MIEPVSALDRPNRLQSLDALRGVAAMIVLLYHFTRRYGELFDSNWHPLFSYDGQFGVLLFFMISGYVITLTTQRVRRPIDFFFFRFSRLYPTYWFCMLVTAAVVLVAKFPLPLPTSLSFGVNLTMLTKTIRRLCGKSDAMQYIDGSYWSLEIELFFYATVFLLLLTKKTHRIVAVAIFFVALGIINDFFSRPVAADVPWVAKVFHAFDHWPHFEKRLSVLFSVVRWACFFEYWPYFGIGIAVFARQKRGERVGPAVLLLLCMVAATFHVSQMPGFSGSPKDIQVQLIKVFAASVLFVLAVYDLLPPLRWRGLITIGAISYPLYLLHQYIGYATIHAAIAHGLSTNIAIVSAIVVAFVLGTAVSVGIERPAMHALRRLYLRVAHHPATATPISGMAPTIAETPADRTL